MHANAQKVIDEYKTGYGAYTTRMITAMADTIAEAREALFTVSKVQTLGQAKDIAHAFFGPKPINSKGGR